MSSFLSSLYILDISPLSDVELMKIFPHFIYYHFVRLIVSFALQKYFSFMRFHLLIFYLRACDISVLFRNCHQFQCVQGYFIFIRFSVSSFMLRSLSTWTWVLCKAIDMDLFAFFYRLTSSYASTICQRHMFFFPLYNVGFFVKSQVIIDIWIYV